MTSPIGVIGGFESTYQPAFDVDVAETTEHAIRWREDLTLLRSCGVVDVRYPIRWHRVERSPGRFDWAATDEIFDFMGELGLRPIVDLLHHTSYPWWLGDFGNKRFRAAFLRYVEAFACRYPATAAYTLFNEPLTTVLLCGEAGIWPPGFKGIAGFVQIARNVMPALAEASRLCRELLPAARHVYVDVCERGTAASARAEAFTDCLNDRRFFLTDVFVGREIADDRPFVRAVVEAGGEDLVALEPGHVDVLGLDYYAHNQWVWDAPGQGRTCAPSPPSLFELAVEYHERYRLPCIVGETNIRGFPSDRATWLKYVLEQCEAAREAGVPLEGVCWFPFVDSCDWDSILCRTDGNVDPVGVMWLDERLERHESSISASYRAAAAGTPASALPAYELQPPVSSWLAGWLPQMRGWDWQPPPPGEVDESRMADDYVLELKVAERGV